MEAAAKLVPESPFCFLFVASDKKQVAVKARHCKTRPTEHPPRMRYDRPFTNSDSSTPHILHFSHSNNEIMGISIHFSSARSISIAPQR
jgi:hypothetical protein